MNNNIDRAAEVIYRTLNGKYGDFSHHGETAQALADAGLLAPDLPEPMQHWEAERTGGEPGSRWYGYEDDGNSDGSEMYSPHRYIDGFPGEVWIDGYVLLAPEDAKAYALALLAAAVHAEGVGRADA